jgi:vinexin
MTPEPVTPSGKPLALARAKFNFNAQSPKELQLTKGDFVVIRKKIDNNWYDGELRMHKGKGSYFYPSNGSASASGIFPCTYVEVIAPLRIKMSYYLTFFYIPVASS